MSPGGSRAAVRHRAGNHKAVRRASASAHDCPHSDQPVEIDAGAQPHRLEHEDEVLGDDIARGARRERAAAEAAERGVEGGQPAIERGEHVGEPQPARVVQMDAGQRRIRPPRRAPAGSAAAPRRDRRSPSCRTARPRRSPPPSGVPRAARSARRGSAPSSVQPKAVDRLPSKCGRRSAGSAAISARDRARLVDHLRVGAAQVARGCASRDTDSGSVILSAPAAIAASAPRALGTSTATVRPGNRLGEGDHLGGVGELRQELGGHEAADLDLA